MKRWTVKYHNVQKNQNIRIYHVRSPDTYRENVIANDVEGSGRDFRNEIKKMF